MRRTDGIWQAGNGIRGRRIFSVGAMTSENSVNHKVTFLVRRLTIEDDAMLAFSFIPHRNLYSDGIAACDRMVKSECLCEIDRTRPAGSVPSTVEMKAPFHMPCAMIL